MTTHDDGADPVPSPRTPPNSPSTGSPPSSRKKSVFGSIKTHMTVVRAAISNGGKHERSHSATDLDAAAVTATKKGELYAWDGFDTDTPKTNFLSKKSSLTVETSGGTGEGGGDGRGGATGSADFSLLPDLLTPDLLDPEGLHASEAMDRMAQTPTPPSGPSTGPSTISQKRRTFYMTDRHSSNSTTISSLYPSPGTSRSYSRHNSRQISPKSPTQRQQMPLQHSWSWSEQFFFSQDDESVSTATPSPNSPKNDVRSLGSQWSSSGVLNSTKFEPIIEGVCSDDEETCNNTIVEKVRQRSKKASRASTVGAFVTFLKALFGIGMLSNPAVLGEVGLLLGTFCHLFIVVGCAFACYLLLAARKMAKMEVMAKERRDQEKREEYEMWKAEMDRRAVKQRSGRRQSSQSSQSSLETNADMIHMEQAAAPTPGASNMTPSESCQTLEAANTGVTSSNEEEWTVAPVSIPLQIPLKKVSTFIIPPKQGWGRCEDALSNSIGLAHVARSTMGSKLSSTAEAIMDNDEARAITPSCGNVQMIKQRGSKSEGRSPPGSPESIKNMFSSGSEASVKRSNRTKKSPRRSQSSPMLVSDEYQQFTDKVHNIYMMSPPPPPPPRSKMSRVCLVTYGDVAKCLAGKRASFFIIFTIVTVHLMFASGMVHLAVENLCYVIGWERLGWSYVDEYVEQDEANRRVLGQFIRRLGPSEDEEEESYDTSGDNDRHNYASRSSDEEEYCYGALDWVGSVQYCAGVNERIWLKGLYCRGGPWKFL